MSTPDKNMDDSLHLTGTALEALARAAHEMYCEWLQEQGYSHGLVTDHEMLTHRALKPYSDLDETMKESNRDTVRDIPEKLAEAGYRMVPAEDIRITTDFPGENLDPLARREHNRWAKKMRSLGWQYGPELDEQGQEHPSLVPWDNLDEAEREKDRQMVLSIPALLKRAGFAIVPSDAASV